MLQSTGSVETPPIEAQTPVPTASEEAGVEAELCTADSDVEVAELTACVRAAVVRNVKRSRTVSRINSLVLIVAFSLLFPLHRGIAAMIGWFLCLCLVNLFAERTLQDIGFSLWAHRSRRAERDAVRRLTARDDVRSVGDLLDALHWMNDKGTQESAVRPEIWQALVRLLPRLTEEQAQQLGKQRHARMARWMFLWENPLLRMGTEALQDSPLPGIMHVMSSVGRSSIDNGERRAVPTALPPILDKWIAGEGAGQDPVVQQAAVACREAIRQKMALAHSGEQLLRASAPTGAAPDSLLRPAQSGQQTEPQELLRPEIARRSPEENSA